MDRLFNSTFENSNRLMILLDECDMPKTLDWLYIVDFMAVYSATFGINDQNLNGNNSYQFSEFASHRENIKEALKNLVLTGTAQAVGYNSGISYIVTPEGEEFCKSLSGVYAREYRENVRMVIKTIGEKSERTLIEEIYRISGAHFREEVIP